ncbi:spermidine/putrescine ABC transporter ATP-binding protein [Oceanirhabdus sp. W0125-5]|uniref:spermidine/putrescine ABC transporter ATP-binding protein n=1 Tax=Oceanirhabdus sp. W0125-5 TaxID=2999116 RepID=UPI0022F2ECBB|nr:spermidine/putrescine ABC transporter ATP-binding protein [Oceanirhabdus sp. W0125-5]WBW99327.1 ABC transporter ATP-binding protein [Oceanirhabdus sp. W0125-5]
MNENIINLVNIKKEYDGTSVLNELNLYIRKNEFLTLLGPSGCGKTTTLRIIGGFEEATSGKVLFNDKVINDVPPYKRNINTVFQKYALFPHMNIYDNIAFGLKIKKMNRTEIENRVKYMLKLVGLEGYEYRSIDSLSGGQQQRIAIARSLINEPEVLLLDEPLGALDLKLRKEMQIELKNMQKKLGITFIYVTHDQEEALTMSDTIVVMDQGKIQQIGTPVDIYNEPKNAFVAKFIGDSNIIDGIMIKDYLVKFCGIEFECVDYGFGENTNIDIVVRPEDIKMVESGQGMMNGVIKSVVFKGVHYELVAEANGFDWLIHSTIMNSVGTEIGLVINPEDIHVMSKMEG